MARMEHLTAMAEKLLAQVEQKSRAQQMPAQDIGKIDSVIHHIVQKLAQTHAAQAQQKESAAQQQRREAQLSEIIKHLQGEVSGAPSPEDRSWLATILGHAPTLGLGAGAMYGGYKLAQAFGEAQRHATKQPCPVVMAVGQARLVEIFKEVSQQPKNWISVNRRFGPREGSIRFDGKQFESVPTHTTIGPMVTLVFIQTDNNVPTKMWLPDPVSPHGEFTWLALP